jgi:hypothetical protein
VEAASIGVGVTATEPAFHDFGALPEQVAEVGELAWDGLVEQDESNADDDEEQDNERVRSFNCMRWKIFPTAPQAMIRAEICRGTVYSASEDSSGPCATP